MLYGILPRAVIAPLAFICLITTPVVGFLCLMPFAILRLLVPVESFQRAMGRGSEAGATAWLMLNRLVYRLFHRYPWKVQGPDGLQHGKSYLLICNHQSWIDILVLGDFCYRRLPFPRFFLKQELIWVPVIGLGCWAMDMPFMKRHSREDIRRNPALKGQDLETTRKFCERFRTRAVTVINFVEGTRFTPEKRDAHNSPYRHLLRPKSAGVRIAIESMGEQFAGIIDLTVAYKADPRGVLWSFLRGDQHQLVVNAELLPVPADLLATAVGDEAQARARFQNWINSRWDRKDQQLAKLAAAGAEAA